MAKGESYEEFVEKFKPKKTTDDCHTPDLIYEAVAGYVADHYGLDRNNFIRPFWPGGDYEKEDYSGKIVVDNPPFSILSKIRRFYLQNRIKYFIFAPALTIFNAAIEDTAVFAGGKLEYKNGAIVRTAFCTNLEPDTLCRTAPELQRRINEAKEKISEESKKKLPKYQYPDNVIYSAKVGVLADHGVSFSVCRKSAHFIRRLDAQKQGKKAIFGSGYLISSKAAAEKVEAEKAAAEKAAAEKDAEKKAEVFELSEEEKEIIKQLDAAESAVT